MPGLLAQGWTPDDPPILDKLGLRSEPDPHAIPSAEEVLRQLLTDPSADSAARHFVTMRESAD